MRGGRYGGGGRGVGEGNLVFDKMDWGGSRKRERGGGENES